jgi:hypothetical protein
MKQLINPVDFDKIDLLPKDLIGEARLNGNDNTKHLTALITKYIDTHKLRKSFQSRKAMLRMNDNQDLMEIKSLYDYLLSFYATIDNDENIRDLIKKFPALEPSEFTFPQFLTNSNAFLKAPYTLILIIMKIRRFKKLEYILKDINDINTDVNRYLNDRYKS